MTLKICCDSLKKAVKNGPEAGQSAKPKLPYAYTDATKPNTIRYGTRDDKGMPPTYASQKQIGVCPFCEKDIST